jgi:2'-5' RNA ligase
LHQGPSISIVQIGQIRGEIDMALHTATVYLPEAEYIFNDLEVRIGKYFRILTDPHITVVNPFYPKAPISVIERKLQCVAQRTNKFTMKYKGISRFEDSESVLYYIAVENEKFVTDLHYSIYASISGLIDDQYEGKYNLVNFTPHVSIGGIPKKLKSEVESALAGFTPKFEAELDHYSLCAENEDRTWTTLRNFYLSPLFHQRSQ